MAAFAAIGTALFVAAMPDAKAAEPAALVEEISAERPGLQFMDFLEPGHVVTLAAHEHIVLGYMATCLREKVTGGKITVGREESLVEGGSVEREEIDCSGGALRLTAAQAQEAGAMVFRKKDKSGGQALPRAQRILYGVSPMLRLPEGPGRMTITRLDVESDPLAIDMKQRQHDLAADGIKLEKGGLYLAEAGGKRLVFKISALAGTGTAILGRLLAF